MTDRDPSPQDILAQMVSEAGDDAVGEWRVRIPTPTPLVRQPPSFAVAVRSPVRRARRPRRRAVVAGKPRRSRGF